MVSKFSHSKGSPSKVGTSRWSEEWWQLEVGAEIVADDVEKEVGGGASR